MKTTQVLGHDYTPEGDLTVLYCGHKVPGALSFGQEVECHKCEPPEPLTAAELRDVAWALDSLSKLTRCLYEPIARGGDMGNGVVTVKCELTQHGEPMPPADAQGLVDWVSSSEMQDALRAWADGLEGEDVAPEMLRAWGATWRDHAKECERERDAYRDALERIEDHTPSPDDQPDARWMRSVARQALHEVDTGGAACAT